MSKRTFELGHIKLMIVVVVGLIAIISANLLVGRIMSTFAHI
jgi:hypothetical protein